MVLVVLVDDEDDEVLVVVVLVGVVVVVQVWWRQLAPAPPGLATTNAIATPPTPAASTTRETISLRSMGSLRVIAPVDIRGGASYCPRLAALRGPTRPDRGKEEKVAQRKEPHRGRHARATICTTPASESALHREVAAAALARDAVERWQFEVAI